MLKLVHWIISATDYTVNNINHARVRVGEESLSYQICGMGILGIRKFKVLNLLSKSAKRGMRTNDWG